MPAIEKWEIPDERIDKPLERQCERDGCRNPSMFSVQHCEYSDHLKPSYVCGKHLATEVRMREYSEGDEFFVRRVNFK